jgi:apolipoprotein N-acyltransferase
MKFPRVAAMLPDIKSIGLALLSAILLILAFPDFEYWFLAWVALVPLLIAVEREKDSLARSFVTGWIFGIVFFFGTCWWLTFAPITYAGFPAALAYALLFLVTVAAALFYAAFAAVVAAATARFGRVGLWAAPFAWVTAELARYWLTGNNWNTIGYSQAFGSGLKEFAVLGGVGLVSFLLVLSNAAVAFALVNKGKSWLALAVPLILFGFAALPSFPDLDEAERPKVADVVAVQPDVPMSGLTFDSYTELRRKHVRLSQSALAAARGDSDGSLPTTVIFPESPMNFMYDEDPEFRDFVSAFAASNNVNVLFNSAEPDAANKKYFNSAVLVDTEGREIAQYDKIYLLPFGESVPGPLQAIVPAFVGSFSYGKEYDLIPLGDAKAGVMICFESHFGELSRRYVRDGADVLIEMTNDGYLGPTPVLRQHLANAVFRAVETNRPVLRVTNVGVTAYINERGDVIDPAESYTEATRVWSVSKSDGTQTFYVKYGDWFAWLCSIVTIGLLIFGWTRKPELRK